MTQPPDETICLAADTTTAKERDASTTGAKPSDKVSRDGYPSRSEMMDQYLAHTEQYPEFDTLYRGALKSGVRHTQARDNAIKAMKLDMSIEKLRVWYDKMREAKDVILDADVREPLAEAESTGRMEKRLNRYIASLPAAADPDEELHWVASHPAMRDPDFIITKESLRDDPDESCKSQRAANMLFHYRASGKEGPKFWAFWLGHVGKKKVADDPPEEQETEPTKEEDAGYNRARSFTDFLVETQKEVEGG